MLNKYKFGIELECIAPYDARTNEFINSMQSFGVTVGGDGSIQHKSNENGLELKTLALSFENTAQLLQEIERECRNYNIYVNDSCGLHVHVSNPKFMENKNLRKILGLWVAIEDVFFATQPESRLNSNYCKRRLASYAVAGFPKLPEEKRQLVNELGQSDRYYALNFASLKKHGTLECRLHAGTLNAEKIIYWMELLKAFYEYALGSYKGKNVNELFLMPTSDEKIDKVWKLLNLNEGTRRHFDGRIEKFMVSKLANQHQKAQEIIKFRIDTAKEEDKINKVITKSYKMEDAVRERFNREITKSDKKSQKMRNEVNKRKGIIQMGKEKLLKEFVGDGFRGNLNDLTRPWSNNSNRESNSFGSILENAYRSVIPSDSPELNASYLYANTTNQAIQYNANEGWTTATMPHPQVTNHNPNSCDTCSPQRNSRPRPQTATGLAIERDTEEMEAP